MRTRLTWVAMAAAFALFGAYAQAGRHQDAKPTMVYELRTYTPAPGKLDNIVARFRDHTAKLFEKYGMKNVGYWVSSDAKPGEEKKLIYVLAHKSRDAAKESFAKFAQDPEWKKAKEESEKDGPIVVKVESVFMEPTDFSKLK